MSIDKSREWAQAIINGRDPERDEDSDLDLVVMLEDEIEQRGLQIGYVMSLMRMLKTNQMSGMDEKWALIRATPEQRVQAFLEVVA